MKALEAQRLERKAMSCRHRCGHFGRPTRSLERMQESNTETTKGARLVFADQG